MSTVTDRFREERNRLGYSQARIGDLCGVRKATVNSWEDGSKIPTEALAALAEAGIAFDFQYIITGVHWGQLGPIDDELVTMTGSERAKAVLHRVAEIQETLGVEFSKEQLQILMGYAFDHCPTREGLASFVCAAFGLTGNPLPESKDEKKEIDNGIL